MEIADLFDIVLDKTASESLSAAGPAVTGPLWPTIEPTFAAIATKKLRAPGRKTVELIETWKSESEENAQQLAVVAKLVGVLTLSDLVSLQLQESRTKRHRSGLKKLKELGVPEAALAALLAVLAGLTPAPYLAGRNLGPATIQAFFSPAVHWLLALGLPVLWFFLVVPNPTARPRGGKLLLVAIVLAGIVGLALLTQPREQVRTLEQALEPGTESRALSFDLPYPQKIVVSLVEVQPPVGVSMNICGTETDQTKCVRDQYGMGAQIARALQAGNVQLSAFNVARDRAQIKVSARYWDRLL